MVRWGRTSGEVYGKENQQLDVSKIAIHVSKNSPGTFTILLKKAGVSKITIIAVSKHLSTMCASKETDTWL